MRQTMPQDMEVRYILPAIRRELSRIFVQENSLSQKEAADALGLTEAAVSQYINSKRAKETAFGEDIVSEIRKSAKRILADKKDRQRLMAEMYRISSLASVKHVLCSIHKANSRTLENCNLCFDNYQK